jgi:hypothetical protein
MCLASTHFALVIDGVYQSLGVFALAEYYGLIKFFTEVVSLLFYDGKN